MPPRMANKAKKTTNENLKLLRLRIQNGTKLTKREEEI
jgi:hypothetical protein